MVASCAAYNCSSRSSRNCGLSFFSFPLGNPTLLKKWVKAIRRDQFQPSKNSRICSKHFTEDNYQIRPEAAHPILRTNAVPSVFDFVSMPGTKHRTKKLVSTGNDQLSLDGKIQDADESIDSDSAAEEKIISNLKAKLKTKLETKFPENAELKDMIAVEHCYYVPPKFSRDLLLGCHSASAISPEADDGVLTLDEGCHSVSAISPEADDGVLTLDEGRPLFLSNEERKLELASDRRVTLTRKLRTLQQRSRRQNNTIKNLKQKLKDIKKKNEETSVDDLKAMLSPVASEIVDCEMRHNSTDRLRYSDTVKEFATTLFTLSRPAYNYVRTVFTLPHPKHIKKWTSGRCGGLGGVVQKNDAPVLLMGGDGTYQLMATELLNTELP